MKTACHPVRLASVSAVDFAPEMPPNSPERRENPVMWRRVNITISLWARAKARNARIHVLPCDIEY